MHKLLKIAGMELRRTVLNTTFILLTICGPVLISSVVILPGFLATSGAFINTAITRIAITGADQNLIQSIGPALAQSNIHISSVNKSAESLASDIAAGTFDGYVAIPKNTAMESIEYVSRNATDFGIMPILENIIGTAVVSQRFERSGFYGSEARSINNPPAFVEYHFTRSGKKEKSPGFIVILTTGLIFASLLYMTILFYGQIVGRSVLMEKTNKTVEILLSSVRPVDILLGKIVGNAIAGILQYGIWVSLSVTIFNVFGPRFGVSLGTALTVNTFLYLVLFFILAYFLYCTIYAILGAISRDERQLTQLSLPVIVLLIIPVMLITSIITSPQAPVIVALSFFPFTAPIVMFIRILLNAAPSWQILLSVFLMLLTTSGGIVLSATIFSSGILLKGKK